MAIPSFPFSLLAAATYFGARLFKTFAKSGRLLYTFRTLRRAPCNLLADIICPSSKSTRKDDKPYQLRQNLRQRYTTSLQWYGILQCHLRSNSSYSFLFYARFAPLEYQGKHPSSQTRYSGRSNPMSIPQKAFSHDLSPQSRSLNPNVCPMPPGANHHDRESIHSAKVCPLQKP